MKSHKHRIRKLEDETMNKREDVPEGLQEIYAQEDDPQSDMSKAMEALYNPNRGTQNPNDSI